LTSKRITPVEDVDQYGVAVQVDARDRRFIGERHGMIIHSGPATSAGAASPA
jgi:hypothetical protein